MAERRILKIARQRKKKIKSQSNELEKIRRIIINSIKEHI